MSVLVVGDVGELAEAIVRRLVDQGDDVAIIVPDGPAGARLKGLGAHVAPGDGDDADLIERAAQGARTIVVLHERSVGPVLEAAHRLPAAPRVILCADAPGREAIDALGSWKGDYVVMGSPKRGLLPARRRANLERIAEAVDAADDLAGEPRIKVDLTTDDGWRALKLDVR